MSGIFKFFKFNLVHKVKIIDTNTKDLCLLSCFGSKVDFLDNGNE